jgi:hypothetical protein
VFSLDAPINGTARAAQCRGIVTEAICGWIADVGGSLIHEMADRWTNLATLDSQIVSKDSNAVYIDIGTHGEPAYDIRTNGTYDSYIPQLVMSSCDVGVPRTSVRPPSRRASASIAPRTMTALGWAVPTLRYACARTPPT